MANVIGVRFKKAYKVYYFDPRDIEFEIGDGVIVETIRGIEYGTVVIEKKDVAENDIIKPLKPIIRKADTKDMEKLNTNQEKERTAFEICREKVEEHKLAMKLINVEYTFDGKKIIFFFTAEGRVDFRELVKDLASIFRTRIELRQIGVRDETKMIGGLGPCGRPCCCALFLGDFRPVSIKMAKEQNLSLSPTKISGLCGRLMCCLNYEQEYYEELHALLPRLGREVITPDGKGIVIETNAIKQTVKAKVAVDNDEFDIREYPLEAVRRGRPSGKRPNENEIYDNDAKKESDADIDAQPEE